jgi:hypothetical protein
MSAEQTFITSVRHPDFLEDEMYWWEYRECYNGGSRFVDKNLKKFSTRETDEDFKTRKFFTPIPSYAKAAVTDVRNSIFQRLRDVTRRGGSTNYMRACAGEIGGIDNKGQSMQSFLGIDVLTELLVMGRVGVYTDMPVLSGFRTMADEGNARPYCYFYRVEDILSWAVAKPEEPGDFTAILLRDRGVDYNQGFAHGVVLPSGGYNRYRLLWVDPSDRKVKMKLFDEKNNPIDLYGNPKFDNEGVIPLELERIPFTMLNIGGSLLKDVYKHQVALLNLGSSDVSYVLKANFPFFIEQKDMRAVGAHLKKFVDDDGTGVTTDNSGVGSDARNGITHGRTYDLKADAPSFIHPSSEPLMASIKLQEKLEDDIRKIVNLAVQNKMGKRATSAEALKLSDQGLEAGLSYIGMVIEGAERRVAEHFAAYESRDPAQRNIATIKYPDRYSLKNDDDRIKEAKELSDLMYTVPGNTVKKELSKNIVTTLLAGKVDTATIDKIFAEIDKAGYTTSNPEIIRAAVEAGLCGDETGSEAMGFNDDEYLKAREDRVLRAKQIMEAQSQVKIAEAGGMANAAARGVPELAIDQKSGEAEREQATDTTTSPDSKAPVRGKGKNLDKGA